MHRGHVENDFILHVDEDEKLHDLFKKSFEIQTIGVKMEEKYQQKSLEL